MDPVVISDTKQTFQGKAYYRLGAYFKRASRTSSCSLHRAVWEAANGKIAQGLHIHHVDKNPLNNRLSNLECLSPKEHAKRHATEERSAAARAQLDKVRPMAAAWHSSEEGLAWHRENGRKTAAILASRPKVSRECQQCGKSYKVMPSAARRSRFCHANCRAKNLRDRQKEPGYKADVAKAKSGARAWDKRKRSQQSGR